MATNYAHATYTEVIDLQTTADKISIIGIHTPVGRKAYTRLRGFFKQFRKFKYNGIKSLVMVPAANLPVDPLGLTGNVGTTDLMDPRDTLNPILFHGCHGESLTSVLDTVYRSTVYVRSGVPETSLNEGSKTSDSAEMFDLDISSDLFQYYSKLTDSSWRKFGIQSGVKLRNLHPLVHQVVQNMPTLPAGNSSDANTANAGLFENFVRAAESTGNTDVYNSAVGNSLRTNYSNVLNAPIGETTRVHSVTDGVYDSTGYTRAYKQQFTNRMSRLGWLPTAIPIGSNGDQTSRIVTTPKLFMGLMILPPAYNIEQFFRMVITHSFSFKEFTSTLSLMDESWGDNIGNSLTDNVPYANWIDYGDTLDSIAAKSEVISDGVS